MTCVHAVCSLCTNTKIHSQNTHKRKGLPTPKNQKQNFTHTSHTSSHNPPTPLKNTKHKTLLEKQNKNVRSPHYPQTLLLQL